MWSRRDLICWWMTVVSHQISASSERMGIIKSLDFYMKSLQLRPNTMISRPCLPLRPEFWKRQKRQLPAWSDSSECSKILEIAKPGTWRFLIILRLWSTQRAQNFDRVFSKMQNAKITPLLVNDRNFFQLWKPENNSMNFRPKKLVTHAHSLAQISKKSVTQRHRKLRSVALIILRGRARFFLPRKQ